MIVIDNIIFYLQKAGGVSVVWQEIIQRILRLNLDVRFLENTFKPDNLFYKRLRISDDSKLIESDDSRIRRYLPVRLNTLKNKFIFHSSYYRYSSNPNAVNITTVHDFTYEYYFSGLKKRLHSWQKKHAILNSDYIICISENTKNDLLKFIPEAKSKDIRVIYNGVSESYYPLEKNSKNKYNPFDNGMPFLLFVGDRSTYKNFKFCVNALRNLQYNFLIVGKALSGSEIDFLNKTLGSARYKCLSGISNEQLNLIYNSAFAFLYPSAYEGFGIPVIEAQRAGCPVIAYNASSIPEIIGDTPLLLKSLDDNEFTRCMQTIENNIMRNKIICDGLKNSARFTWDNTFTSLIKLYNEIL